MPLATGQLSIHSGGKNVFHTGLRIVKIALHSAHMNVVALLGHHLCPLNLGNTAVGVEYTDPHTVYIAEACQCGLAGVTGGGGEDQNILLLSFDGLGFGQKLGQHTQSHILKCGGGAPEQLQHGKLAGIHRGGQLIGFKFAGIGFGYQSFHLRNIRQKRPNDPGGHGHGVALQAGLCIKGGQGSGDIQTSIGGQTVENGLRTVGGKIPGTGGMI